MIRAIVHVFTASRDIYGNCYHAVRVTNTETGQYVACRTNAESNPRSYLRDLGLEWNELYSVHEVLPIRQWYATVKGFEYVDERAVYGALFGLRTL